MGRQKEELSIFEQMGGTYTLNSALNYNEVKQKVLGNLSQLIGIYLLQQNILATGNDARAENYLKENGEMQVLSSGGGILQNGGEAETEEPEENEFLDFSFGG